MLDYTWAKLHAALNDLPAALLLAAVLFDLAGWVLKRETLRAVGLWTLWGGVIGGWAAYVSGRMAEDAIDHGDAIHQLMQRHERLALYVMILFTVVLAWKLWRRGRLSAIEDTTVRLLSIGGLALLILTAIVGGRAVFDHAAGVSNDDLVAEMRDRKIELPAAPAADDDSTAGASGTGGHEHAPGTPAHEH
jgi:uncharacterized membrane protein